MKRTKGMKVIIFAACLAFLLTMSASCGKVGLQTSDSDGTIAFYIKADTGKNPSGKAMIDDTGDLLDNPEPIYVTDEAGTPAFSNNPVNYTGNGVWKSAKEWADKSYSFYAYIASPLGNSTGEHGGITVSNSGKQATITQPDTYADDKTVWADYLMSYRVAVEGKNRPLVKLDMERTTTCVELYVAKSAKMKEVTLKKAEFRNVCYKADFDLQYHATPGDNAGLYGMKNTWNVRIDDAARCTYSYELPAEASVLADYTSDTRFADGNRKMRFLTVHQNTGAGITLYLEYTVSENGTPTDYTAEFPLSDYSPASWNRGHKIRYFISIDSSIDLEGTISKWESVDFIETTFLPE